MQIYVHFHILVFELIRISRFGFSKLYYCHEHILNNSEAKQLSNSLLHSIVLQISYVSIIMFIVYPCDRMSNSHGLASCRPTSASAALT